MVSWSEATEQRGRAAPPLAFRRCVIPETGDRKADLRMGSIGDDVKVAADQVAADHLVAADHRTARICLCEAFWSSRTGRPASATVSARTPDLPLPERIGA